MKATASCNIWKVSLYAVVLFAFMIPVADAKGELFFLCFLQLYTCTPKHTFCPGQRTALPTNPLSDKFSRAVAAPELATRTSRLGNGNPRGLTGLILALLLILLNYT